MTPTLNVNLKPCRCQEPKKRTAPCEPGRHRPECGGPVLIPCPLPPKVEFTVRLGACSCTTDGRSSAHRYDCPARTLRVTCTIAGETWEGSEVTDWDVPSMEGLLPPTIFAACRERWALVKALVLGAKTVDHRVPKHWRTDTERLFSQRDAVFAALAAEVRTAADHSAATQGLFEALKAADLERDHVSDAGCYALTRDEGAANAVAGLQAFVEIAIATVGALP